MNRREFVQTVTGTLSGLTGQKAEITAGMKQLKSAALLTDGQARGHQVEQASGEAVVYEGLRDGFLNPSLTVHPMVRWWWPGGDVTDDEISRELQRMKDAGIGGVEIQSFTIGLNPSASIGTEERVYSFLSSEWFGHIRHAIKEGRKLGMIVDVTFGSGWPFGGPYIPPELGSQELIAEVMSLEGPSDFEGKIPWVNPEVVSKVPPEVKNLFLPSRKDPALFKLVAVVAVRGSRPEIKTRPPEEWWQTPSTIVTRAGWVDPLSAVVLTDRVRPDRTIKWTVPEGHWLLFSFIQGPTGQQVVGGAGKGGQFVLDHMKKSALEKHIDALGDAAKPYYGDEYGKGLRAIFCDSLEVTADLYWQDSFLQEFYQRRGYELTPYLPLLRQPGYGRPFDNYLSLPFYDAPGMGERIRHDYWRTVSEVMIENFYQPLIDWGHENRLKVRIQAHGSPTDIIKVYGNSDIPETETLYAEGVYDFLKFASSGAHLYGRKIISSESFVWWNHDYETTPEKIKRFADELLTAGVNEIIYHGFPYDYRDRPEPGWYPFSSNFVPVMTFSSHLNFHNPFWEYLKPLHDYIGRIQFISQTGRFVAPVAIYTHYTDFPNGISTDTDYPLEYSLMANGFNFDFINEDVLLNHATVIDHKLQTPGGSYQALVLRNERRLNLALVEKLRQFSGQGLPIVFVETSPSEEIGYLNYEENGRRIRKLVAEMLSGVTIDLALGGSKERSYPTILVKEARQVPNVLEEVLKIRPNLKFRSPQPNIFFAQFDHGPVQFIFIRNPKPKWQKTAITLPGTGMKAELWDPWTGRVAEARQYKSVENMLMLDVRLNPYGTILLAVRKAPQGVHVIRHNFLELRTVGSNVVGVATKPGAYCARLSNGKIVNVNVSDEELPAPLHLGPDWLLKAVGKDKNGDLYSHEVHIPELKDWTLIPSLRYFSGKGHYVLDFHLDDAYLRPGLRMDLDLGDVHEVAEVAINHNKVQTLIMRPYRLDVTDYLQRGNNHLKVTVQNTLRNRLVGDGLRGDPSFLIFKNRLFYMPSGMLGPVRLTPIHCVTLTEN